MPDLNSLPAGEACDEPVRLGALERALIGAAVALYLFHLVHAILASRGLYADGVYYFTSNLEGRSFLIWGGPVRTFAQGMAQWPVVAAVRLGVTHLPTLLVLQGSGLFGWHPLSLLACWWVARDEPRYLIFPLIGLFAGAMNAEFDVVTDSHRFVCLYWPLLLLMLFRADRPAFAATWLLAIPTLAMYESMLVFGPFLAAVAVWRGRRETAGRLPRVLWILLAGWFLAGAVVALEATLAPAIPSNRENFLHSMFFLFRGGIHVPAWFSFVTMLAVPVVACVPLSSRAGRRLWFAVAGCGVTAGCVVAALPLLAPATLELRMQHEARVLNLILPLVLTPALLAVRRWPSFVPAAGWRKAILAVAWLAVVQSVWHLGATYQWTRYLAIFRHELETRSGVVAFEQTALSRLDEPAYGNSVSMSWYWTSPLMSVVLAPGGRVGTLIENPIDMRSAWQPFDPNIPAQWPDLSRYGISYERLRELSESSSVK